MRKTYYLKDFFKALDQKLTLVDTKTVNNLAGVCFNQEQQQSLKDTKRLLLQRFLEATHTIITVREFRCFQFVRVMGFIEYRVNKLSGEVVCFRYVVGNQFEGKRLKVDVKTIEMCLPMRLTDWIVSQFLALIKPDIKRLLAAFPEQLKKTNENWFYLYQDRLEDHLTEWLKRNINANVFWRHVQYTIKEELWISPQVYSIALKARYDKKCVLRLATYNQIRLNSDQYIEVNQDNPNLLWLLHYLLNEDQEVTRNAIYSMKITLLREGLSEQGWRMIANGHKRQIPFLFSYLNVKNLVDYLQLLTTLQCQQLLPKRLNGLFHDPYWWLIDQNVKYREALVPVNAFRKMIQAYLKRGVNDTRLNRNVSTVLTWLAVFKPNLDKNQRNQPWSWYEKTALQRLAYEESKTENNKIRWDPYIEQMNVDGYHILGIQSKWELKKLAVTQRHCIDTYGDECMQNETRVFVIKQHEQIKCTVAYDIRHNETNLIDIRGFANRKVGQKLEMIAKQLQAKLEQYLSENRVVQKEESNEDKRPSLFDPIQQSFDFDIKLCKLSYY